MTRFEIQEMISQTDQGVTFLALDKQTQCQVALRRFFPQGRAGDQMTDKQLANFEETCRQLGEVRHPGLRAVIGGDVDPADKTPYLATEWIEGHPLCDILAGQEMGAAYTLDVLRTALEVSLALSVVFGQQGVWVDTQPKSIIVDPEEGGRGYTFWVCPGRWLGWRAKQREVGSLAKLAEELTGWNLRAYTETSGGGLGAWVKAMKAAPQTSLDEALRQLSLVGQGGASAPGDQAANPAAAPAAQPKAVALASPSQSKGEAKPVAPSKFVIPAASALSPSPALTPQPTSAPTHSALSRTPTRPAATQQEAPAVLASAVKANSSKVPMIIMAVCVVAVVSLALVAVSKRRKQDGALADAQATEKQLPGMPELVDEAAALVPEVKSPTRAAAAVPGPQAPGLSEGPLLTPADREAISKLADGAPLRLRATVQSMELTSKSGNLILYFSKPPVEDEIRVVAYRIRFEGPLDAKSYDPYVGKQVLVSGVLKKIPGAGHPLQLVIERADQISMDGAPEPSAPVGPKRIALTPRDTAVIAKLSLNQPVRLQGRVKEIRIPPNSKCMRIEFEAPANAEPIHVAACRGQLDGRAIEAEEFEEIVQGLQHLLGKTIRVDGVASHWTDETVPRFVRIQRLDQIAVEQ